MAPEMRIESRRVHWKYYWGRSDIYCHNGLKSLHYDILGAKPYVDLDFSSTRLRSFYLALTLSSFLRFLDVSAPTR